MSMLRRIAPAVVLFFLSPLIAEWLLGDLNWSQIGALIALAPLYGGGAILIREILKRSGRGWPAFLFLGLAYALLEEGMATQSLFNPNYLHLRLLDYGFIPALGTSLAWSVYVLSIHVVWSLAVPIGLTESLFPTRASEPWLGRPGLVVSALLYAAGLAMVTNFSLGQTGFRASALQLGAVAFLVLVCIAAAFAVPRAKPPKEGDRPIGSIIIAGVAFMSGSLFLAAYGWAPGHLHLPWSASLLMMLVFASAFLLFVRLAQRGSPWSDRQTWAAAFGAMLCYAWFGYGIDRSMHGAGGLLGHSLFVLICLGAGVVGGLSVRRLGPDRRQ